MKNVLTKMGINTVGIQMGNVWIEENKDFEYYE